MVHGINIQNILRQTKKKKKLSLHNGSKNPSLYAKYKHLRTKISPLKSILVRVFSVEDKGGERKDQCRR